MTPKSDWLDILKAAHRDPIDPAHYTAVRARVLAEIERTRSPWRRYAWLSGAIAAALALLALLYPMPRPAMPALSQIAYAPLAPMVHASAVPRPKPLAARLQPLTIKLQ